MHRLFQLAALALSSVGASAQSGLDLQPCNEVHDAGTLNLVSGVLTPANGPSYFLTEQVIYDNTCDTGFYTVLLTGNMNIDEGRLPSTSSPAPNVGTLNKYRVTKFRIGYCTQELAVGSGGPGASITVNFWENYTPCTASTSNPPPVATFALTGLPASASLGALTCHELDIDLSGGMEFYMLADGDGAFDTTNDFAFSYAFPNQVATGSGPIINGDVTAPGACAAGSATYYNTPGAMNGTGLDNADAFYREGTNLGQTVNACLWFGGPTAFHAGFYMRMYGDLDDCNGNANPDADDISSGSSLDSNGNSIPDECECGASSYCTAGTSLNSCTPVLSGTGAPSASATSGYTLAVSGMDGQRPSGMFYGLASAAIPINAVGGGTSYFCTTAPRQRLITPTPNTGGTVGACDGMLSVDLNTWLAGHPAALGNPYAFGQTLYVQAFNRDSGNPSKGLVLSAGLAVTLCP